MMKTFKYVVFFILCVILVSYASFEMQSIDIRAHIQEDGSARITEEFSIYIEGQESIELYEESLSTLSRNNIQSWFHKLQLQELIYHIGGQRVDIENLIILPEPAQKVYNNAYTTISISYDVLPSPEKQTTDENISFTEEKGLFILKNTKPRTTEYTLNRWAFLDTTENGDLILSQNTKLTFLLPEKAKITTIYPVPDNLKDKLPPYYVSTVAWTKPVLPKFTLVFEVEETLESEIVYFFNSIQDKITKLIQGPEGIPTILIIVVILISIIYLHKINKKD